MSGALRGAVAGAALALLVPAVAAQLEQRRSLELGDAAGPELRIDVRATPGAARAGGNGFVTVELANGDPQRAHTLGLVLQEGAYRWRNSTFEITKTVTLEPEQRARVVLPLPTSSAAELRFVLDGSDAPPASRVALVTPSGGSNLGVLVIAGDATRAARIKGSLEILSQQSFAVKGASRRTRTARGRRSTIGNLLDRAPEDLPGHWSMLTGFDLIVVDGTTTIDAERQRELARACSAGTALLVVGAGTLAEGSVRRLVTGTGPASGNGVRTGRHGLGHWLALAHSGTEQLESPRLRGELTAWLGPPGGAFVSRAFAGPFDSNYVRQLDIPGLGGVPARMFFLLLLGFAIVVGPVNFVLVRRRLKRPMLMLVTVPVIGFGFTALILTYGLFSEGFGIKGVARSVTLIDQRTREAVCASARTLYAGLSPAALEPSPDTWVRRDVRSRTGQLEIDLDHGARIAGSALPSRTVTGLFALTEGRARERLRFRRDATGALEVLAGPEITPLREAGAILLRDFDGTYYESVAGGTLRARPSAPSPDELWERYASLLPSDWHPNFRRLPHQRTGSNFATWARETIGDELPHGSYLARVSHVASFDSLGLSVDWLEGHHLVRGRLAEADIVD